MIFPACITFRHQVIIRYVSTWVPYIVVYPKTSGYVNQTVCMTAKCSVRSAICEAMCRPNVRLSELAHHNVRLGHEGLKSVI